MDAKNRGYERVFPLCILVLAVASLCSCQTYSTCEPSTGVTPLDITCTNLGDLITPLTATLSTTEKPLYSLKITKSPQLVLKNVHNNPRFADLTKLDLSDNDFTAFHSDPFQGLSKLDKLFLNKNNLTSIHDDTFSGLESITRLRLNENHIDAIDVAAFNQLKNLIVLDLSDNKLSTITPSLFHGLGLKVLDLSSNSLTTIDPGTFDGLTDLLNLGLSHNPIRTIDPRAFQYLQSLIFLELRYTKLESIDSRLFNRNHLVMLDLKGNHMENLNNFQIYSSTLRVLRLANCNIDIIPLYYFTNVPNLFGLDLEDNKIETIEPRLLTNVRSLITLSLRKNQLKSLDVNSFNQMYSIMKSPKRNVTLSELSGLPSANLHKGPVVDLDCNPWDLSSVDMIELREWCEDRGDVDFDQVFTSC